MAYDNLLPDNLSMGAVTLKTGNVDKLRNYYEKALGLVPVAEKISGIVLGRNGTPLVSIESAAGLKLPSPNEAGLFHTAILFNDRSDLAAAAYKALRFDSSSFVGSSDHLVSEAFYFQDPDNNGIELYIDRPRDQWRWTDGRVAMDTTYLPWDKFINENLTEDSVSLIENRSADLGHVHLQVGDIPTAKRFYADILGFDVTTELGNMALFVAAGGYHHHMAMNTWNSTGAGPRRNTLGLGSVEIHIPNGVDAAVDRLKSAGHDPQETPHGVQVNDPWHTKLILRDS